MRNRNFCCHFLAKFSIDLNEMWYSATQPMGLLKLVLIFLFCCFFVLHDQYSKEGTVLSDFIQICL